MQADALAALLEHLDMVPAVIAGVQGGAGVSLLTASRHREDAARASPSGGSAAGCTACCRWPRTTAGAPSPPPGRTMEAVAALPEWEEVLERNPSNRQRFLDQQPAQFVAAIERWTLAYCPRRRARARPPRRRRPRAGRPGAGLPQRRQRRPPHPRHLGGTGRVTSAGPPGRAAMGRSRWLERQEARDEGLFARWPLLAPALLGWQGEVLA